MQKILHFNETSQKKQVITAFVTPFFASIKLSTLVSLWLYYWVSQQVVDERKSQIRAKLEITKNIRQNKGRSSKKLLECK